MKSWFYGVLVLLLGFSSNLRAKQIDDISSLQGREIVWSSPYKKASDAEVIFVKEIIKGKNFYDNGDIIINNRKYPIDQLFVKNDSGQYENLLSITGDNIIQGTFFIKYYNEDLLAIDDEIIKIKSDVKNCIDDFYSSGIKGIEKEALEQEKCLDDIYYRCVDVFYANSKEEMLKNYMKLSDDIKENYFLASEPDYCYGKCGTIEQMKVYDRILEIKKKIIVDLVDNILREN
ncbi:MAG: hypothetical protein IJZ30_00770 [Alphaproteobacteria bacterium]|nr:hypothetical protein [Alphaproteobacteria bacterium]